MKLTVREMAVFGMLGAVMYASKMLMELFPNMHLVGTFIVAITVTYRKKALYPIYVFVLLTGLFSGFATPKAMLFSMVSENRKLSWGT